MPLHDVKCLRCDHIQEAFWLPNQKPNKILCEQCGSDNTKIIIGKPNINVINNKYEKQLESEAADKGW